MPSWADLSPFPDAHLNMGTSPHGAPSVERLRDGKSENHRDGEHIKREREDQKEDSGVLQTLVPVTDTTDIVAI